MYCFVEYKMLLFNPTLQETIGDDIIYIISKPPKDSAYGSYRSTTESNRRLLLCLCTDTGMVYFGYPFFLFQAKKKRNNYSSGSMNVTLTTLLSGLPVKCSNYPAWDIPSIGLTIHVCKPHANMLLSSLCSATLILQRICLAKRISRKPRRSMPESNITASCFKRFCMIS